MDQYHPHLLTDHNMMVYTHQLLRRLFKPIFELFIATPVKREEHLYLEMRSSIMGSLCFKLTPEENP